MNSHNIIEEYLVKLGFEPDNSSLLNLTRVLGKADDAVAKHTGGMLGSFLKMGLGIVGTMTGISAAVITMAERVSMADQRYRLFGLSMLMTTDSARKLKMITDELGESMEEIIWDPESHERAVILSQDMDDMGKSMLGADFEGNMRKIRDMRFQFVRLHQAVSMLEMGVVNNIFKELTGGSDDFATSLKKWMDNFKANAPALSQEIATNLVPVLRGTYEIMKDIWDVTKGAFDVFSSLIALLTGDDSINNTTSDWEKLHKVLGHVKNAIHDVLMSIKSAEKFAKDILQGNFAEAFKDITEGGAAIVGGGAGGAAGAVGGTLAAGTVGEFVTGVTAPFLGPLAPVAGIAAAAATPAIASAAGGVIGAFTGAETQRAGHAVAGVAPVAEDGSGFVARTVNRAHVSNEVAPIPSIASEDQTTPAVAIVPRIADSARDTVPAQLHQDRGHSENPFIQRVADLIEKQEGFGKPGALPTVNNNPGDLKYVGQHGAERGAGGFARFPSYEAGRKAEIDQIMRDISRGSDAGGKSVKTVEELIRSWSTTDQSAYVNNVAAGLHVMPNSNLIELMRMSAQSEEARVMPPPAGPMVMAAPRADNSAIAAPVPRPDVSQLRTNAQFSPVITPGADNSTTSTVTNHIEMQLGPISITQPGAGIRDIQKGVAEGATKALESQTQFDLAQLNPYS